MSSPRDCMLLHYIIRLVRLDKQRNRWKRFKYTRKELTYVQHSPSSDVGFVFEYTMHPSHDDMLLCKIVDFFVIAFYCSSFLPNAFSPSFLTNSSNLGCTRGFMNMSVTFSEVGMYLTRILLSSTASQMKWYLRSMCFVHKWNLLSLANAIAPWLSHSMVSGPLEFPCISLTKFQSQIASLAACVCTTYSASVLDSATMLCFFELQDIAPLPKWNEKPEIECRCCWLAQSKS